MTEPLETNGFYEFGPYRLDRRARVLLRQGAIVQLTPKVFDTLLALVENRGEVISKDELMRLVWHDSFVEESNLAQNISVLRKAFGQSSDQSPYIETIPKRGYRFLTEVKIAAAEAAPPEKPIPAASPAHRIPSKLMASGVAILALAIAAFFWYSHQHRPGASQVRSIAVLPLKNLSGDPAQDYFAEGITEELITELAKIRSLKVISRTSVMHYKGTSKTLPQIARELNVDAVVEGSVQRSGSRVRVTSQLIQAETDQHLWGEAYERDSGDMLAIEVGIARAISDEIEINLSPQERQRLASSRRLDPEAREAYLKGRYEWNRRGEEALKKSLAYYQRSIDLAPAYAAAYSGLADSYIILWNNGYMGPTECVPKARAATLKALEIDDSLAEAHTSLAWIFGYYDWNWAASEREFRRALELNPSYANARHWYGFFLVEIGRTAEGIEEIKKARQLDPLSPRINANVGNLLFFARQYGQAIDELNKALELSPDDPSALSNLGFVYLQIGKRREAIEDLRKADQGVRSKGSIPLMLAQGYAMAGERDQARKLLEKFEERARRGYVSSTEIALVYACLRERNQAFAWLEKAFAEHDSRLLRMKVDPIFDPLRSDQRFQELLRRIRFPT